MGLNLNLREAVIHKVLYNLEEYSYFWTGTIYTITTLPFTRTIYKLSPKIGRDDQIKGQGLSVRCIKNN